VDERQRRPRRHGLVRLRDGLPRQPGRPASSAPEAAGRGEGGALRGLREPLLLRRGQQRLPARVAPPRTRRGTRSPSRGRSGASRAARG
jgi:hypothetical protein